MIDVCAFRPENFSAVQQIYQEGIDTGNATFETRAKGWEVWDAAMLPVCRLVAMKDETLVGWAALSLVSSRSVYAGVAWDQIYVGAEARGMGVGRALLSALIPVSEAAGIWTLQAGIFPENTASLTLHSSHGFRQVGVREKLGRMGQSWRDVILMERRSKAVGTKSPDDVRRMTPEGRF